MIAFIAFAVILILAAFGLRVSWWCQRLHGQVEDLEGRVRILEDRSADLLISDPTIGTGELSSAQVEQLMRVIREKARDP